MLHRFCKILLPRDFYKKQKKKVDAIGL